ncbi:uncharacterized protein METZ01_LOCUS163831 [marine metagenome]|uniref:Uncharacterized protein n=1 Tax=marine metagenome TaxID=408172 RepID=A0A382BCN5_9ZZZZ
MFEAIKETLYLEKSLLVQNELKLSSSNERNYRIYVNITLQHFTEMFSVDYN